MSHCGQWDIIIKRLGLNIFPEGETISLSRWNDILLFSQLVFKRDESSPIMSGMFITAAGRTDSNPMTSKERHDNCQNYYNNILLLESNVRGLESCSIPCMSPRSKMKYFIFSCSLPVCLGGIYITSLV